MRLFLVTGDLTFTGCYLTPAAIAAARMDKLIPDDSYILAARPAKAITVDYDWAKDTYFNIRTLEVMYRSLLSKWS